MQSTVGSTGFERFARCNPLIRRWPRGRLQLPKLGSPVRSRSPVPSDLAAAPALSCVIRILTGSPPSEMQKPVPIFDTNVLADVQRDKISQSDWSALLRHRPGHGWPLSSVTAFERLAAVDAARPENFPNVKQRIALAYNLCKGRVLEDARFLICRELLHIPAPETLPRFAATAQKHMDVVRRANSFDELTSSGVQFKSMRRRRRINRSAGPLLTEPVGVFVSSGFRHGVESKQMPQAAADSARLLSLDAAHTPAKRLMR
jgi:hypothetical protein